MKNLFTAVIMVFLASSLFAQVKLENIKPIQPETILQAFESFEYISYGNSDGTERHYTIPTDQIFDHFGNDGTGTIGSKDKMSEKDLIMISFFAIKGLFDKTNELNSMQSQFEESINQFRDSQERVMDLENELNMLRDKLNDFESQIMDLNQNFEELKTQNQN